MLVSYDKEGNWGGIIPSLSNKNVEIPESVSELFNDWANSNVDSFGNLGKSFLELAKSEDIADESFKKFLQTTEESGTVYETTSQAMSGYEQYLKKTTRAAKTAEIGTKALSAAMKIVSSIGWMLAISAVSAIIGKIGTAIDENIIHKAENATEAIENTMSAYESSKSDLESLNSELQTTQDKINDLESKDALTFTEQSELDNLKAQNNELERSIKLQEAKSQAKLQETITTATNDYKDSREEYFSTTGAQIQSYKDDIEAANRAIADAKTWENQDGVADYIADQEKIIEQSKSKIETYTTDALDYAKKVESMISTFEQKPKSEWSVDETATYNQMKSDLDQIYKDVLSKGEYTEWKIQPVFEKGKLKDAKDQILQYFSDGGTIDGLADKFGDDIMQAIRQACDKNGVAFSDVINSLYAEATDNLSADALKKKLGTSHNVNSAYEAKQYNQDKEVNDYIDSLSVKDRQILATIDFDEDVTVENLKKALAEAQDEADQETITSNINFTADTATAKSAMSSLTDALADYKENGLEKMDISKLQALNNEDTFGNINGSTQDLENFLSVMNDVNSTADQVQDAFDSLASAYLYSSQMAEQVTDETLGATQAQLEQMGVINAQEVAYQMLINKEGAENVAAQELIKTSVALGNAKYTAENASKALENASFSDTVAMVNEANSAGQTSSALINMAISKANIGTIQTDGDINNLIALCNQLGVATSELQAYAAAKAAAGAMYSTSGKYSYAKEQKLKGQRDTAITNAKVGLMAKTNASTKAQTTNSGGSTGGSGGGGGGSKKETTKTEIDWLERAMTRVGKKLDIFKAKLENIFDVQTKASNLSKQIKLVEKEVSIANKQVKTYDKKATNVKLSKSLKTAVQEGRIKGSLSKLISKYGEKTANKIDTYRTWYDKAREAEQTSEELKTTLRDLQEQQYQLYVDDAEANIDKLNAQKDIAIGYADQNNYLEQQKAYLQQSYEYQIKIAELTGDQAKKAQLEAELQKELRDLEKEKFENIKNYYENEAGLLDNQFTSLDNKISEIESSGADVSKSYYESQKTINDSIRDMYDKEKQDLLAQLPYITQGTDAWYDAKNAIQECDNKISDCVKTTYDLNNAINELHFNKFSEVADDISRVITEQEFLQGLFAHEKTVDEDTAQFTEAGIAKLGSITGSYYLAKQKAERDAAEVAELQKMVDTGSLSSDILGVTFNSTDDLEAKLKEMYSTWQDDIKETYSLESDMVDMMKDRYQSELDLVQDLIDKKKESLNLEKDLHDYQRTIQQKTTDINTLRKQITAIRGDTSQEGLTKLQKLQVELSEKEDDLRETEYDRFISDQQDMLDKLYEEYEELITKKLDDFMGLFKEATETSEENQQRIGTYLSNVATDAGYTEQTKGLFSGISTSIKTNADNIVAAIEKINITPTTPVTTTPEAPTTPTTPVSEQINGGSIPIERLQYEQDQQRIDEERTKYEQALVAKQTAEKFIKNHLQDTKTKKKDMTSEVNKKITTSYPGKCLSDDNQKKLANKLGVSSTDYKKKSGALYQKLHELNVLGFSRGGVISVDSLEKQVKANGDSTLVSGNLGERILTPVQNDLFEKFVGKLPELNQMTNMLQPIVDMPKMTDIQPVQRDISNNINAEYNFTLENCTNADDIIRQIQQNSKVQKALRAVTTDQLVGSGRLSVNRIR